MKIAIVDDEKEQRELLCTFCDQYAKETGAKITTKVYESSDDLLLEYKVFFDIIIFDIDMPGTNGMEAARKIREVDKKVTILFMTNIAQYAINGYEVEAIDYVIKPIEYYEFSMKFRKAINAVAKKKDYEILIDAVDGTHKVLISDILYVEIMSHYLIFHTENEIFKARGSMREHKEILAPYHFCQVHRSYLANLKYVESIQNKSILIKKEEIPLGRNYKEQLMQEYMRYVRG